MKSLSLDEFSDKFSPPSRKCNERIAAKYHDKIVDLVKLGMSPIEVHRKLVKEDNYPGSYNRLCYYLRECTRLSFTHHHIQKKTHCKRGHPFDDENTMWLFDYDKRKSRRACRICRRMLEKRREKH